MLVSAEYPAEIVTGNREMAEAKKLAPYIVIEGMGGAGKTTQMKLAQKAYPDKTLIIREPGGTAFGEDLRRTFLAADYSVELHPKSLILGMYAARNQLLHEVVLPTLHSGITIISDRADASTWAFQVFAQMSLQNDSNFWKFYQAISAGVYDGAVHPTDYIFYDLDPIKAKERVYKALAGRLATGDIDQFDAQEAAFYKKTHEGYLDFFHHRMRLLHPEASVHFVDASKSIEEVHACTLEILEKIGV